MNVVVVAVVVVVDAVVCVVVAVVAWCVVHNLLELCGFLGG